MMAQLLQRQLVGVSKHRLQVHMSKYVGQQSFRLKQTASVSRSQEMSSYGSLCCIQRLKSKSLAFDSCCKKLVLRKGINIGHRSFHTTQPRYEMTGITLCWIASIFMGRWFRKWWGKKSKEEKAKMIDFIFHKNKWKLLGTLGLIILGSLLFYFKHLEITPITKRKRFIFYNHEEVKEAAVESTDLLKQKHIEELLPNHHPLSRRVAKTMRQLLAANREAILRSGVTHWTIYVIDKPDVKNAMVTPDGCVFVYSGAEKVFQSDDELGCLLAHEMAHLLLNHGGELRSTCWFSMPLNAMIIATAWAFLPDFAALLAMFFGLFASDVFFILPHKRRLEFEADEVGLMFGAKACFDVRAISLDWAKMAAVYDLEVSKPGINEILATHPDSRKRQARLDKLIPEALILRESCNCKPLSPVDPRDSFESWRQQLELEYEPKKVETVGKIS